ncbi:MAG: hypothetical protein P8175_16025 [Deltaproteobacteria bacterium]|jgi:uncharacterized membrane protein
MSLHAFFLLVVTFLASMVEVIEMATIVLGVGMTRGWPFTALGSGAGMVALVGALFLLGPALGGISIRDLRATIGILLLLFGVQWFRKGILRVTLYGLRPRPLQARATPLEDHERGHLVDWTAFVLSFKGVLLEGAEVVFIILTFGVATHHLHLAVAGAGAAFVVVAVGAGLAYPSLLKIPGHVIKYAVGLLLVSYGTFWGASGLGARWPGSDLAILPLLGLYGLFSFIAIRLLRYTDLTLDKEVPQKEASPSYIKGFALFWYRFLIGDDWIGAVLILAGFAGTYWLATESLTSYWLLPLALLVGVSLSLYRGARNSN